MLTTFFSWSAKWLLKRKSLQYNLTVIVGRDHRGYILLHACHFQLVSTFKYAAGPVFLHLLHF